MQLRLQSGATMVSERMLMPKWAQVAARRLSDEQLALFQEAPQDHPASRRDAPHHLDMVEVPLPFPVTDQNEDGSESVAGTVSRKGKFGFVCEKCSWVPYKGDPEDWIDTGKGGYVGLHFPDRCKKCRSRMKRWTCAARNYDKLELLRQLEGRHCLRFVTFTHEEWNVTLDVEPVEVLTLDVEPVEKIGRSSSGGTLHPLIWGEAERLKKKATKKFNNWRNRNKYWKSREAKGQAYYEVTMKPVWNGWGWDEVQLHFHIHTVVCSKRLENKDIQHNLDTLEPIPMSTTMQREWGGVVDVRACKTWKHKDGEMKTSKRFVMNYLVDYINKSPHWQSTKFGDWSS